VCDQGSHDPGKYRNRGDGGGIRGAIVARGLTELEEILGVKRLIDSYHLKVEAVDHE
jgi:patatin-like phospholipase/acyl hydrolase